MLTEAFRLIELADGSQRKDKCFEDDSKVEQLMQDEEMFETAN
jgi:hypothetical protein